MAANRLTKAQRQELGRRTQRTLRARIAEGSLPQDYYRQLGRKGFQVTLLKYGPERIAHLLSAYYGRQIEASLLNRDAQRERAATRRAYPIDGQCCAVCGEPATERDHRAGLLAGHAPGNIAFLCRRCHVAAEVARIKAS